MNVWIKVTRKRAECYYCHKMIETGEYQVVCTYFMTLKHSETTWMKTMRFHARNPNCWLDRAIAELESRPHIELKGRKPDAISDENKIMRQKILRRRSSVMQRIRGEMEGQQRPSKLIRMIELLGALVVEIEPFGGVPKSW